ncbi:MAG: glycosyltransferase, partial [Anaerolineales bacterium]
MSRAKIALIANTDWYLYNFRASFAKHLLQLGHEVIFICPSGAYTQAFKEMGIQWVKWDVNRQIGPPWQELGSILRLAKIYREHEPHIVHAHTLKAVLYASLASFFGHTPMLVNSIAGRGHVYSSNKPLYVILRPVLNVLFW